MGSEGAAYMEWETGALEARDEFSRVRSTLPEDALQRLDVYWGMFDTLAALRKKAIAMGILMRIKELHQDLTQRRGVGAWTSYLDATRRARLLLTADIAKTGAHPVRRPYTGPTS